MKRMLMVMLLAVMALVNVFAQDTLVVEPSESGNAIINQIVADTSATGEQLHKVYKLVLNGNYTIDQTAVLKNPIQIVADDYDLDDADKKPPIVRILGDDTGAPTSTLFFRTFANFTCKNIYFGGMTTGNQWMAGNWLQPSAADISIKMDGLIFDYLGWSIIASFDVPGVSYYAENVYVKNAINAGDLWSPFFLLNFQPVDTFAVKNCTYFQSNGMFLQSRTPINYVEIDHCTFANEAKPAIYSDQMTHAVITNNIFYNTKCYGISSAEHGDQDRDGYDWGIVNVDTLPANEVDSLEAMMTEAERILIVKNNVYFDDAETQAFFDTDTMESNPFMNERVVAMFADDEAYPNFVEEGNVNADPGFKNIDEATALMNENRLAWRQPGYSGDTFNWGVEFDMDEWPDLYRVAMDWPRQEDLSYTADLVGTDGYPVGDLNWFAEYRPVTSIDNDEMTAETFSLSQNYPNPFNPTTTINYSINKNALVKLNIYDMLGHHVKTLVNGNRLANSYSVKWNATNEAGISVPTGVYFYRLQVGDNIETKKMLLIK